MIHAPIEARDELLRLPEVQAEVKLGKTMIYRLERQGRFPQRIKVGGSSRWSRLEVQAWIAARRDEREAA